MAENAGTQIVGESESGSLNPTQHAEIIETKAREKGWSPLEQWRGQPEDWVDAREFLGRQKLFDKIHDLQDRLYKQSESSKKDMQVISKHFVQMQEVAYQKAKRELEAQRKFAISEKDVDSVVAIEEEMKTLDKEHQEVVKTAEAAQKQNSTSNVESPAFVAWKEANKWFDSDKEMREDAVAIGVGYAAANPGISEQRLYEHVTSRIQRLYPDKFQSRQQEDNMEQEETPIRQARVEKGNRPGPRSKSKLSVADLSQEEQIVMRTLLKRNVLADAAKKNNRSQEDEYLAQVAQAKGL